MQCKVYTEEFMLRTQENDQDQALSQHKLCTEYTWREAHVALKSKHTNKRFTRHDVFDDLLESRFPNFLEDYLGIKDFSANQTQLFLEQLKKQKFHYLYVFKQMRPEEAEVLIPGFDRIIGFVQNDGDYDKVLDIYKQMKTMLEDGLPLSKASLSRMLGLNNKSNAISNFLRRRDLEYTELVAKAKVYVVQKQKLEVKNDPSALELLEQKEHQYEGMLSTIDEKRGGKRALAERKHVEVVEGVVTQKPHMVSGAKKPAQIKHQAFEVPSFLKAMPSMRKSKVAENTTDQVTETNNLGTTTITTTVTNSPILTTQQAPIPATKTSQYTQQTLFSRTADQRNEAATIKNQNKKRLNENEPLLVVSKRRKT